MLLGFRPNRFFLYQSISIAYISCCPSIAMQVAGHPLPAYTEGPDAVLHR